MATMVTIALAVCCVCIVLAVLGVFQGIGFKDRSAPYNIPPYRPHPRPIPDPEAARRADPPPVAPSIRILNPTNGEEWIVSGHTFQRIVDRARQNGMAEGDWAFTVFGRRVVSRPMFSVRDDRAVREALDSIDLIATRIERLDPFFDTKTEEPVGPDPDELLERTFEVD